MSRAAKPSMPTIRIGPYEVSRFICGGNPFSGFSHMSDVKSDHFRRTLRDNIPKILSILEAGRAEGMTAFLSRGDEHMFEVIRRLRDTACRDLVWMTQTAPERPSVEENIDEIVGCGTQMIYLHGGFVKRLYDDGQIERARDYLKRIHDAGTPAGMASHEPKAHLYAEEHGFETDFHCVPMRSIPEEPGVVDDETLAVDVANTLSKPVILYKVLAAGRIAPKAAFEYVFSRVKRDDFALCVGTTYEEEIVYDIDLLKEFVTGETLSAKR